MRSIIWLVLLFGVAVIAATTLGGNDGLVSIFYGAWRTDLSLNLFVVLMLLACALIIFAARSIGSLLSLPERAREWRQRKSERAANAALREALAEYLAARWSRSQRAAQRLLSLPRRAPALAADAELRILGQLLAAASLHRLRQPERRDEMLKALRREPHAAASASAAEEGACLMAIEWAIDDRDGKRANELLAALPAGVTRRTQALRLRLLAQRLTRQPLQALQTARLLAKHQAFSPPAARSLLRGLAIEALTDARDAEGLQRTWRTMAVEQRRDAMVAAAAAQHATSFDDRGFAHQLLKPWWSRLDEIDADERAAVALATMRSVAGIGSDWLAILENALADFPSDATVAAAAGAAFVERQLWGKAHAPLEQAAGDAALEAQARRQAWRLLARLARDGGDEARALACESQAAQID